MVTNRTPAYNLKVVVRETGVNADVLRAWERRYGLPTPERTSGGHRLYSQYDIETVKWLVARQNEGLSISRAVDLWNEFLSRGEDPLTLPRPASQTTGLAIPAADASLEELRQAWIEACLGFNETAAEQILNQAFAIFNVETVCTGLIQRSMFEVGELWHSGKVTVQQEHFTSALATRRLDALISAAPRPTRPHSILIACPPKEWHTFSSLLLTLLLRRQGFEVIYLGANVPDDRMVDALQAVQPKMVVLAAQQLSTAATLRTTAEGLQKQGYLTAYGGSIFNRIPKLREAIPALFLGETLEAAVETIEKLVTGISPAVASTPTREPFAQAAELFRQKRPQIEMSMLASMRARQVPSQYIETANFFFGNELAAALELGDPAFLASDLEWIRSLIRQHNLAPQLLQQYLLAYAQIGRESIGESGDQLFNWIESFASEKLV